MGVSGIAAMAVLPGLEAVDHVIHHVAVLQPGHGLHQRLHHLTPADGGDEHPRLAVVDDVLHLRLLQAVADGRVVQAGTLCRPADLKEPGMVLEQDGDVIAALEAQPAKQLSALVGGAFEFGVGDGLAGLGHHVGDLVGLTLRNDSWVHVLSSSLAVREPESGNRTRGPKATPARRQANAADRRGDLILCKPLSAIASPMHTLTGTSPTRRTARRSVPPTWSPPLSRWLPRRGWMRCAAAATPSTPPSPRPSRSPWWSRTTTASAATRSASSGTASAWPD
jgi:hypothetical protein